MSEMVINALLMIFMVALFAVLTVIVIIVVGGVYLVWSIVTDFIGAILEREEDATE